MDEQLGYDKHVRTEPGEEQKNYRNGSTKRKLKTQLGEVEISVPRDRNGEYEPKINDNFMEYGYASLRNIHKLCNTDIRFIWLLDGMSAQYIPEFKKIWTFLLKQKGKYLTIKLQKS